MNPRAHVCLDKFLPHESRAALDGHPDVLRAVFFVSKLWPNGSKLRVRFIRGTRAQQLKALADARVWSEHANLSFVESDDHDAEIRVSFMAGDGAWSYLGTDALRVPRDQPTMNLGFDDVGTYLHEFGHAIGMGHEHQNPEGGIEWDENTVVRDLSGPPNFWDDDTIRHNVLRRYQRDHVRGSRFDPRSIMLYFFPARWTKNGLSSAQNTELSDADKEWAREVYPGDVVEPTVRLTIDGEPMKAEIGTLGEEDQYVFEVAERGTYIFATKGKLDLTMTVHGPDSLSSLVARDNDAGQGLNPRIVRALEPGRYLISVRHISGEATGDYTIRVSRRKDANAGRLTLSGDAV
jgi:hypothetical protein